MRIQWVTPWYLVMQIQWVIPWYLHVVVQITGSQIQATRSTFLKTLCAKIYYIIIHHLS